MSKLYLTRVQTSVWWSISIEPHDDVDITVEVDNGLIALFESVDASFNDSQLYLQDLVNKQIEASIEQDQKKSLEVAGEL